MFILYHKPSKSISFRELDFLFKLIWCFHIIIFKVNQINNLFFRLIQEEKQSTEARAEELESRVGSLEHMNLLARGRPQSPPLSGRSSPNSPNRDYLHKFHTVRDFFFIYY